MRIRRWLTAIAIATVCVLVFVQGGVADAASSTAQHAARHAAPAPAHQHGGPLGTASSVPLQIVDLRSPSVTTTAL